MGYYADDREEWDQLATDRLDRLGEEAYPSSIVEEVDFGDAEEDFSEDALWVIRSVPRCTTDTPVPWCNFSETLPF